VDVVAQSGVRVDVAAQTERGDRLGGLLARTRASAPIMPVAVHQTSVSFIYVMSILT
jgi:hypothetical protein